MRKLITAILFLSLFLALHAQVATPPAHLRQWLAGKESPLDEWYQKFVDCDGLPILSSAAVSDTALL